MRHGAGSGPESNVKLRQNDIRQKAVLGGCFPTWLFGDLFTFNRASKALAMPIGFYFLWQYSEVLSHIR